MESSAGLAERGGAPVPVGGAGLGTRRRRGEHPRPAPARPARADLLAHARDYLALTKPRIISLLLWTTVTSMIVARPSGLALSTVLWTCLGGYLAAGGAGAINHYLDREIDARMGRTSKRPIVEGRIEPVHGLIFGIALGALATAQLAITVNALAAVLALGGLVGYVGLYTAWLKPRTPQNIVIGGAAGAMPPLVGWAAATGGLTLEALIPFAIIFLWTPPHFWALALMISDDYERTGVPMLPVVRGAEFTRGRILAYSRAARRVHLRAGRDRHARRDLRRRRRAPRRRLPAARRPPASRPVPPRRPAPLLELARLPVRPVRRDGGRPPAPRLSRY